MGLNMLPEEFRRFVNVQKAKASIRAGEKVIQLG
jgi:hypothetical protein